MCKQIWINPVVLNLKPLDQESSTLTTTTLLHVRENFLKDDWDNLEKILYSSSYHYGAPRDSSKKT